MSDFNENNDNDFEETNSALGSKKGKTGVAVWRVVLISISAALLGCSLGVLLGAGVVITSQARRAAESMESDDSMTPDKKEKVIREMIDTYYLDAKSLSENTIDDGKYKGMLESLGDPYSVYYTEEAFTDLMESTEGTFYGIGVYLSQSISTNEIRVAKPIKKSPAEAAGILADDILIKVNDEDIRGQELSLVVSKVKGPEGTTVDLTFLREGEEYTVTVERAKVEVQTVDYRMEDEKEKIGYIQVTEYDDVTYSQFVEAIDALNEQGMKSLVLDLRGNPGGNVSTVVDMTDELIDEGIVVYTEDRDGNRQDYPSTEGKRFDGEIVVLVDGNSASAAEIMTGALKDYEVATVMGTTTFGKGIVQRVFSLGDGTAVKITVENYFTPNGHNIHKVGIEPDVVVEFDADAYKKDETDNQLNAAIDYLKDYNSRIK